MKVVLVGALALLAVCGCGRTEHDDAPTAGDLPQAGAPSDAPLPGVGPIDTSGQPDGLPMVCPDGHDQLALQLPCLLGRNLAGPVDQPGYHALECELAGRPSETAISFLLPLVELPELLNEPVQFPFEGTLSVPVPGATIGDQRFTGTLSGLITFTQVDLDGRAFVATLEQGHIQWSGDAGGGFMCSTIEGPLWAVAGEFH